MCGIVGYVSLEGPSPDQGLIERMIAAVKHRGPDGQGIHLEGPVGLGHARLSIIDLAGGRQPLLNEDGSVAVVCNGEIYNYRELREQLIQKGHQFRTHSDCEVLVHLWEDAGRKMTESLRGMFAFLLYDRKQGIVFGARDRFGQKPLYSCRTSRGVAFASEIKSLLTLPEVSRDLDYAALDQFLFYSYIPSPRTPFAGIQKLPASSWWEIQIPSANSSATPNTPAAFNALNIGRYWQPTFAPDHSLTDAEHLDRVEAALKDAVSSHMVADVPVGVMLSGGIDSSLIAALAAEFNPNPLETFTVSFPGSGLDEGPQAQAVAEALQTRHHVFPMSAANLPETLSWAARIFDQPLADTAILPLLTLSRETAQHVKVVLTGDGGDELFAGYRKYQRMVGSPGNWRWLSDAIAAMCPPAWLAGCAADPLGIRKLAAKLSQVLAPVSRSEYRRLGWEGWERFDLYQPEFRESLPAPFTTPQSWDGIKPRDWALLNVALCLDQGAALSDRLLLKTDYATMANALESRAPLLDHHLANVAGRLPLHWKATPKTTKVALREIARRHLPAEIVNRRKKGFTLPLDDWYRRELRAFTRHCLLEDSLTLKKFFRRQPIERLLEEHDRGQNHSSRIHTLMILELWCREYLS